MPVLDFEGGRIDYTDDGLGDPVLLVHSSVSGNRQWKRLIQDLQPRFRVLAPNLLGYGQTTPWRVDGTQSIDDQADLIVSLVQEFAGPLRLVGHSFGGSVALRAAQRLGARVSHLLLFEPTLFDLLRGARPEAYAEAMALRDFVKAKGELSQWDAVAERFVEYWLGENSWAPMPQERREAYARLLVANYYEWDGFGCDETPIEALAGMTAKVAFVRTVDARRPIREIAELLVEKCSHWSFPVLDEGGHMAPLARPDLVNPLVTRFLVDTASAHRMQVQTPRGQSASA